MEDPRQLQPGDRVEWVSIYPERRIRGTVVSSVNPIAYDLVRIMWDEDKEKGLSTLHSAQNLDKLSVLDLMAERI